MEHRADSLKRYLEIVFLALLLVLIFFCIHGYFSGSFSSVEQFQTYMKQFGVFGPLVLTLIQAIQVIIPVLPGWLGSIVGVGMFGSAGSFWCNYLGVSAGSILAFLLAKWFGVELVQKMVSIEKYQGLVTWIKARKSFTLILFLAILLPLAPDDFLCWFAGLAGMPTRKFVWIIVLGKPWCILFYSLFFGQFV